MDATRSAEVAAGLAWAQQRLDELGCPAAGRPELVKARAWSSVYQIRTSGGPVWLKCSGGGTRYEARLARALAAWVPGRVLTPLAVQAERGWQLLPDGGTPLRQLAANQDPAAWERFGAGYAELQRELTAHARQMLALGVPDQRPEVMPGQLDLLLQDPAMLIGEQQRAALQALRPTYAAACAALAQAGPAPTIQHDDLHSANVLPGSDRDRFFDWGDASVAHPFSSMLVALRTMADTFGTRPGDPVVRRFLAAYLEPWGLGRDGQELAGLAAWTGMAGRALAWRRSLAAASPDDLAEYGDRASGWVTELLAAREAG
jgi:hypothetical protein